MPKSSSSRSTQTRRPSKRRSSSFLPVQTTRVTEYIGRRLSGSISSSSGIIVPIAPIAYVALLPSIWTFISNMVTPNGNNGDHGNLKESNDLLHAVLDHAIKVPSKSLCKRATVEFVGKLLLVSQVFFLVLAGSPCGAIVTKYNTARHLAPLYWSQRLVT